MRPIKSVLAVLLVLPAVLSAAIRPEFAEIDTLPNSGTLVVAVAEDGELPKQLDRDLLRQLKSSMDAADFEGKKNKTVTLYAQGPYERVILVDEEQ